MNNKSFTFEPELNENIIDIRGKRVIRYFSYTNLWIAFVVIVNEENAGDASQVIDEAMDEFWETDDICYGDLVEEKLRAANIEYIIIYHDPYLESEEYEDAWENYVASLISEEFNV